MDTLELVVTLLSPKPLFHSSDHDRMKKALDILSEFWACRKWVLHFCSGSKAQHAGMAVPLRQEPRKPAPRSESTGYCAIGWERPQTGERKANNWRDPLYQAFAWKMSHIIFSHAKKPAPLLQTVLLIKKERKSSVLIKSNCILNSTVLYLNHNGKIQWFPVKSAIFNSAAIVNLISPEKQLN